ncbi:hypothetical protein HPC49_49205 [Pyxidicoccus fallax]|uniref:Uncharacterized protein n=1 Tax=Pyxidicoccus fallax TaxID=394095 RepID=A0A848LMP0_9BACT|nr:hypothetical protein [Pyxidicoccus fallax]NMO19117.1 hypothetical protein [Pyxidicoccus fallax]NPC86153.1 hypothetical protein [Pyxidicoccus fallax]
MTLGLSILGLFTTLLALAAIFPTGEPSWFGFGILAAALCALGAAFSGPHVRTGMPWAVGVALAIWGGVGLGDGKLSAWLAWATLAFGMAYLGLGALHFLQRMVPSERLPRLRGFTRHGFGKATR